MESFTDGGTHICCVLEKHRRHNVMHVMYCNMYMLDLCYDKSVNEFTFLALYFWFQLDLYFLDHPYVKYVE